MGGPHTSFYAEEAAAHCDAVGIGEGETIWPRMLADARLRLQDFDFYEIHEAFAAQVLACDRELHFDRDKLNVNGGAIALGHPIGCTGTRITVTLLHEMVKRKAHRGLATLCVSGGMGMALAIESCM